MIWLRCSFLPGHLLRTWRFQIIPIILIFRFVRKNGFPFCQPRYAKGPQCYRLKPKDRIKFLQSLAFSVILTYRVSCNDNHTAKHDISADPVKCIPFNLHFCWILHGFRKKKYGKIGEDRKETGSRSKMYTTYPMGINRFWDAMC